MSEDSDIDPVGACVGMRGSRVQSVVQELRGEKIDIIPHNPDPARFIVSALAPAVVSRVIMEESTKTMEVVVPDEQLSLAIGRKGQNVRLASKLSGWKIDVKSETKYDRAMKEGYQGIISLPGVGEVTADLLYQSGFRTVRDLVEITIEDMLVQAPGLTIEKAENIKEAALIYLEKLDAEDGENSIVTQQPFLGESTEDDKSESDDDSGVETIED